MITKLPYNTELSKSNFFILLYEYYTVPLGYFILVYEFDNVKGTSDFCSAGASPLTCFLAVVPTPEKEDEPTLILHIFTSISPALELPYCPGSCLMLH